MSNPTLPSPTPTVTSSYQQPPALPQIQQKVRRLTRSPSTDQLSDSDLNNYINTFIVYDFPEHLRTFNLHSQFTFYTNTGQDTYNTDIDSFAGCTTNPLYNFQNLYLSLQGPFYVAGYQSFFSQSREQFFGIYPLTNSIASIGLAGDGVTQIFTGVINSQQAILTGNQTQQISLLQNQVLFSSTDTQGIGVSLVDVPVVNVATGTLYPLGNLYDPNSSAYQAALRNPPTAQFTAAYVNATPGTGIINYFTGAYTINFITAPGAGLPINSQTAPQNLARPQAILYYQNQFVIRPVPDQPYRIDFQVYQRPTALLSTNQVPELEEYWQFIAYGTARKIFQDRMDMDSVTLIDPEYNQQLRLCLRRTIVQNTNERVSTIYTEQTGFGPGWGSSGWGFGGGTF